MLRARTALSVAAILILGLSTHAAAAPSPPNKPKTYSLWNFDEHGPSCRAKGRLQDHGYCSSRLMDRIVADGKDAIPILISQLRDTRPTKQPIYDYWSLTTAGDIAYFILTDLFTDSDWKTFNAPGVTSPYDNCRENSENCWRSFIKKYGRQFIQTEWRTAWEKNKEHIYWNAKARCFKVSPGQKAN
jgi:hypothetical protein